MSESISRIKAKGRKKGAIWNHVIANDTGKVYCRHCGLLIRIKYGEKVERLRLHFIKSCTKSPFQKDSKEFDELLEQVSASTTDVKKKPFIPSVSKSKSFKYTNTMSYNIGFIKSLLSAPSMHLTKDNIRQLELQGNRCSNWANIKLTGGSSISYETSLERIRGCSFTGHIYIGIFLKSTTMERGIIVDCGLYNSNFYGTCILSDNCYIWNTAVVSNVFVGRNSSIVGCGVVQCEGIATFGTSKTISVGPESDSPDKLNSRSISLGVNFSFFDVCKILLSRNCCEIPSASQAKVNNELTDGLVKQAGDKFQKSRINPTDEMFSFEMSIVCDDVELLQCPSLVNSYIGSYSKLKGSLIENSTLLAHCTILCSQVSDSVLYGSCAVESQALVNSSLFFPHTVISEGAKISESILGPDSSLSVGECRKSLIGPFVGFHHQALLISVIWPLGRGNVGYGGMIGANHTGRLNDQECFAGEGCFFGLGCAISFPFSLLHSPYSLIAAGTRCSPQSIAFPFSLISNHESGRNHLRPAWILWSNPYFIERSLIKFSKRRRSVDYRTDFPVFRPSITDLVIDARCRLISFKNSLGNQSSRDLINDQVLLSGAGRCLVAPDDIDRALEGYTHFIERYALHGLLFILVSCETEKRVHGKLGAMDSDSEDSSHIQTAGNNSFSDFFSPLVGKDVPNPNQHDPLSVLLDDIKFMETGVLTIEEALSKSCCGSSNSDAKHDLAQYTTDFNPLNFLIGSSERCCILTDSHIASIRQHQLQILSKEFSDIDFFPFFEAYVKNDVYDPIILKNGPKIKQLLVRIVDLERKYLEAIISCKHKDIIRANDIIYGASERLDIDDVVTSARTRCDDISALVQKILSLF